MTGPGAATAAARDPRSPPAPGGPPEHPPLELSGIVKCWGGAAILDRVDLRVEPGSAVEITGRNGAGKTTLLRIAAGLITPDRGTVRARGLDPERQRTAFQRQVGLLPAGNTGLYARLKAEQHLELWSRLALMPSATRRPAIARAIGLFALEPLCGRRVDRLSMGQRQRLRLALTFLHDPAVVLLDEPMTSLDADGVALLRGALAELRDRGGAAVVCLPSGWETVLSADRHLRLEDSGLVVQ